MTNKDKSESDEVDSCSNQTVESELEDLGPETEQYLSYSEERLNDKSMVPPENHRQRAKKRMGMTCSGCGALHYEFNEGNAILHIHHRSQNPPHVPYHHFLNLTVFCFRCHRWFHRVPKKPQLVPGLRQLLKDGSLEHTWVQILSVLHQKGPCSLGEIESAVDLQSPEGTLSALYKLMALDQKYESVSQQVVVKDRKQGFYGLTWQIPKFRQSRGEVPENTHELRNRVRDELTRRLDEQLPDYDGRQSTIAEAVDRSANRTKLMERRAQAFQFPLDQWLVSEWYRGPEHPMDILVEILGAEEGDTIGSKTMQRILLVLGTVDEAQIDRLSDNL